MFLCFFKKAINTIFDYQKYIKEINNMFKKSPGYEFGWSVA